MFDDAPDWVIPAIILGIVIVVVVLIIIFLVDHPFISGLLIGLFVGIGGTLIYTRIRNWFKTHKIMVTGKKPDA